MAPAQALDGDDEDANGKNRNMVIKSEVVCTNNCEDNVFHAAESVGGDPMVRGGSSDDKVGGTEFVKDEQGQCTEYSSSFGNSCSQSDDEVKLDLSGMEVDSPYVAPSDGDPTAFDGLPRLFRKKKVTAQWRKTVGPLMWRCQWLELRMKDLLSQISKYDRELALIKHEKDLQLEVTKADGSLSGTAPLSCQGHEKSSMKRRKRKRHEDIVDTSLYIKKHQIFSYYYERQNKGTETDGLSVDDDCNDPVGEDVKGSLDTDWLLGSKESDSVLKQLSLKEILLRLDAIQSRVLGLRDRLNKARCKQEKVASSVDHIQVKVAQKSQKTQKRISSCKKDGNSSLQKKEDGDRPPVAVPLTLSDRAVDCIMEDANLRNSVQNSEGDTTHPDINGITVELLFGADNPLAKCQIGDLCKENTDDVLIDNQAAKEGYQQFEKVKHPAEKPAELVKKVARTPSSKGENAGPPVAKQEPILETPMAGVLQETVVKPGYVGKKRGRKPKKKRGGSTAASSNRSGKSPQTPHAKKQKTENAPSKAASSKLKGEKVVLVAANSRRSQRVRKPKVY